MERSRLDYLVDHQKPFGSQIARKRISACLGCLESKLRKARLATRLLDYLQTVGLKISLIRSDFLFL